MNFSKLTFLLIEIISKYIMSVHEEIFEDANETTEIQKNEEICPPKVNIQFI